mmetsp:Transcript_18259/g.69114  ORF Transcript_18259/g.69114 Transcript_18259/m.69114 type:complete len:231 (+) Transcript_18259:915-1607(+)
MHRPPLARIHRRWRCAARRWPGLARRGSRRLPEPFCSSRQATRSAFGRACLCPPCIARWPPRPCGRASGGIAARPRPGRCLLRPPATPDSYLSQCCTPQWSAQRASRRPRGLIASCAPWGLRGPTPWPRPRLPRVRWRCLPSTGPPGVAPDWRGTPPGGTRSRQLSLPRGFACPRGLPKFPTQPRLPPGQFPESLRRCPRARLRHALRRNPQRQRWRLLLQLFSCRPARS